MDRNNIDSLDLKRMFKRLQSEEFIDFVRDQLSGAGAVVSKRMFGGVGLYLDGLFFAIIENDTLRFKVDETNRADYEAQGMRPFKPYKNKDHTMNYYEVPVDVLEDQPTLKEWAIKTLCVARAAKGNKKRK